MWNYKPNELAKTKSQHILTKNGIRFVALWHKPKSTWLWTFVSDSVSESLTPKEFKEKYDNVEYVSTCVEDTNRVKIYISKKDGEELGFTEKTHSIRIRENIEDKMFSFLPTHRKNTQILDEYTYPIEITSDGYLVFFDTSVIKDGFTMTKGKYNWIFCNNQ